MQQDKHTDLYRFKLGICDFENYWGERLVSVEIIHFLSGILNRKEQYSVSKTIVDIADKTKVYHALSFPHLNGIAENYDYWRVKMTTESGKTYKSQNRFYCSLSESDNNKVILGVNGEAKTLYVAFPSSSGCSTPLVLV
ncbi:hypothetical protein AB7W75_08025 [Providencia huaxiensis]|uniref:Uncharacterized protein n=1 Tax=Providencia rettgeri TaxID=587 RepID=A0A3R8W693_PRORE|nr:MULTISPECIES: hypothetical protein [Providencia]ELR5073932.1 hypothetical protein [Providencia stuartii]ELR5217622.1 hypothetical protein [Providencia rettgeri]MBV2190501.1 hypothetical protein [Providencia rettgeri]UPS61436.1 hypothetical protein M0M83_12420 [Providencia rettgeri]